MYLGAASGIGRLCNSPRRRQYSKKTRNIPYFCRQVAGPVNGPSRNTFTSAEVIERNILLP